MKPYKACKHANAYPIPLRGDSKFRMDAYWRVYDDWGFFSRLFFITQSHKNKVELREK